MKKKFWVLMLFFWSFFSIAATINKVEPPNWWVGMKHSSLELMVYGNNIAAFSPSLSYPGVSIEKVTRSTNKNYLFVSLQLAENTQVGTFPISFINNNGDKLQYSYSLQARKPNSANREGFNNSDAIYLITPDRFANGDSANDNISDMKESANRKDPSGRHGGDLAGMSAALPYIAQLGFTAVWPTPLIERDSPSYSYHGYGATDLYQIDARFGSNSEYQAFVAKANQLGIKIIQDIVVNHIGSDHWWMRDLPTDNWLNFNEEFQSGNFVATNHNRTTIQDPYADPNDLKEFNDGWFVDTMPDLNQRQPLLANYLIQNSIWWIEYAGLQGIREDTYPYADKNFLREWAKRIMLEYPKFNIVGEEWSDNPNTVSYWQAGKVNHDGYQSFTPAMLDFPVYDSLLKALKTEDSWQDGWIRLYQMLSNDYLYPNPYNLVIFEGNHDTARLYSLLKEDFDLYQMAMTFLATMRGIPQMFYGTELAMTSPQQRDDGKVRSDFPGGWPDDEVNAFTGENLSPIQQQAQQLITRLFNWRKKTAVIHTGKLRHYAPKEGLYSYIRYNQESAVLVLLNKSQQAVNIDMSRYQDLLKDYLTAHEIISDVKMTLSDALPIAARGSMVIEFSKIAP